MRKQLGEAKHFLHAHPAAEIVCKKDREKTALDGEPSLERNLSQKSQLVYLTLTVTRLLY